MALLSAPATINGKEVFDLLRDDLVALEDEFGHDTVSNVAAITEIGEHLRAGGGKRIRPALLLLSAKLLNYQGRGAVRLGAVVEIIHTATLVHDDIIDDAKTRRGRPAANTQWGNSKCVLAGDWLYMQAFKIALQERNFRILDTLIELTQQMVEGELLQMEKLGKLITLDEHFDLIFRKTACLFSVCMRLGAILGAASPEEEDALGKYGHDLGMAFQIVDDVLDLTASEEVLGKPVASDLREGKVTMAVIHALERCTPAERAKIQKILEDRSFNGVTHADILSILQRYGALDAATACAAQYAESARRSICFFPDSEIKRALLWAPEFVVAREK
ncbi:MAG TPA: polyprenyl synthetase family protein [Candidatus Sulfotelmatobacter sp.]|nr:polyprenyl synthetase family protein [Candidatus Sulfotelmatobacter sp.]